jgi:hypothetical protein
MKHLFSKVVLIFLLTGVGNVMAGITYDVKTWSGYSEEKLNRFHQTLKKNGLADDNSVSIEGLIKELYKKAFKTGSLGEGTEEDISDYKTFRVLVVERNDLADSDGNIPSRITWSKFKEKALGDGWKRPAILKPGFFAKQRTGDFATKRLVERAASGEDVSAEIAKLKNNLASVEEEYESIPHAAAVFKAQRLKLEDIEKGALNQAKLNAEIERSLIELRSSIKQFTGLKGEVVALRGQFGDLVEKQAADTQRLGASISGLEGKTNGLVKDLSETTVKANDAFTASSTNSESIKTIEDGSADSDKRLSSLEKAAMWTLIGLVVIGAIMMIFGFVLGRIRGNRFSAIEDNQKDTQSDVDRLKLDITRLKAGQKEPKTNDVKEESSRTVVQLSDKKEPALGGQAFAVPEFLRQKQAS